MDVANITANVRVDAATWKGSVIDVIRLVNPQLTSAHAGRDFQTLSRTTPVADARHT